MVIEKSKIHKIKLFKDIKEHSQFFLFFDTRYKVLSEQRDNWQMTKIYKVSQDETLGVMVTTESSPDEIIDSNYSFIFYPNKQEVIEKGNGYDRPQISHFANRL